MFLSLGSKYSQAGLMDRLLEVDNKAALEARAKTIVHHGDVSGRTITGNDYLTIVVVKFVESVD